MVWAVASRDVSRAETDLPMHRNGLRRLQERLDALINEVRVLEVVLSVMLSRDLHMFSHAAKRIIILQLLHE